MRLIIKCNLHILKLELGHQMSPTPYYADFLFEMRHLKPRHWSPCLWDRLLRTVHQKPGSNFPDHVLWWCMRLQKRQRETGNYLSVQNTWRCVMLSTAERRCQKKRKKKKRNPPYARRYTTALSCNDCKGTQHFFFFVCVTSWAPYPPCPYLRENQFGDMLKFCYLDSQRTCVVSYPNHVY